MTKDRIINELAKHNILHINSKTLNNNTGEQLSFDNGAVVSVYNKGTYNIQGKDSERVKNILDSPTNSPAPKNMFVGTVILYAVDNVEDASVLLGKELNKADFHITIDKL